MDVLKAILYISGIFSSCKLAGRVAKLHGKFANTFLLFMIAWAINCTMLFALLMVSITTGNQAPGFKNVVTVINSVFLGLAPTLMMICWGQTNGNDQS